MFNDVAFCSVRRWNYESSNVPHRNAKVNMMKYSIMVLKTCSGDVHAPMFKDVAFCSVRGWNFESSSVYHKNAKLNMM